jgi:arginase
MSARFLVVPQWQGSGSTRAMRLIDGATVIAGDLPGAATTLVEVPLEAGDSQGTSVHRLSSIALVRDRVGRALLAANGPVITIGGDCGVELGAVAAVLPRVDVAVVWLDAHPDLNTDQSSPSGAFEGMVLRTLLGDGPTVLVPPVPLSPARVVIAGARSYDPDEDRFLAEHSIATVDPGHFTAEALVAAIASTGAAAVYLHIDLDVLDQGEISGLLNVEPFGISTGALLEALRAVLDRFELAGAGITSFAPASPEAAVEDLPTILRIIGVLAAASGR